MQAAQQTAQPWRCQRRLIYLGSATETNESRSREGKRGFRHSRVSSPSPRPRPVAPAKPVYKRQNLPATAAISHLSTRRRPSSPPAYWEAIARPPWTTRARRLHPSELPPPGHTPRITPSANRPSVPDAGTVLAPPATIEPPLRPGDESQHVLGQYQPGTISAQCLDFLRSVNVRASLLKGHAVAADLTQETFGVQSYESNTIHSALHEFNAGRLSKREVYFRIMNILGDGNDLWNAFADVFNHKDAHWSPGDFQLPEDDHPTPPAASAVHTSPEFLQPQHQPQVRMPSISAPWQPGQYIPRMPTTQASINPVLLRTPLAHTVTDRNIPAALHQDIQEAASHGYGQYGSYGGYDGYESYGAYRPTYTPNGYSIWNQFAQSVPSSPVAQPPSNRPILRQYESPSLGRAPNFSPYTAHSYGMEFSSPERAVVEQTQRSLPHSDAWEATEAGFGWAGAEPHRQPERMHVLVGNQQVQSPDVSNKEPTPQLAHLSSPNATPSMLGTPIAIPLGQPSFEMLPPTRRKGKSSAANNLVDDNHDSHEESGLRRDSSVPSTAQPSFVHRPENQLNTKQAKPRAPRNQGQFIHAICGKGFTTRSAVKKHHWGAKAEDIATTTGCWFKHNKPNTNW